MGMLMPCMHVDILVSVNFCLSNYASYSKLLRDCVSCLFHSVYNKINHPTIINTNVSVDHLNDRYNMAIQR